MELRHEPSNNQKAHQNFVSRHDVVEESNRRISGLSAKITKTCQASRLTLSRTVPDFVSGGEAIAHTLNTRPVKTSSIAILCPTHRSKKYLAQQNKQEITEVWECSIFSPRHVLQSHSVGRRQLTMINTPWSALACRIQSQPVDRCGPPLLKIQCKLPSQDPLWKSIHAHLGILCRNRNIATQRQCHSDTNCRPINCSKNGLQAAHYGLRPKTGQC